MLIENPEILETFEIPEKEESDLKTYYLYFLWYNETLVYIGQTVDLNSRTAAHKKDKHFNKITYQVFMGITKVDILKIEREHINHFKPAFNDNEKGVVKTSTCVLQRGGSIYAINKLYNTTKEAYYYDGKVLQSIQQNHKGYFYCKDNKKIQNLGYNSYHPNNKVHFYIEKNQLKCNFEIIKQIQKETFDKKVEKKLTFTKGKYKGKLFQDISRTDKNYIKWMKDKIPNYMKTMMN
jgi:predicted GIY-YIG superfamily endonuclease